MADTNLRNYLKNVETLIERSAFDEATAHSRHIIQHFPRNIQAYRLLGQALVSQGRWEEAGDVLRRVLSVYPVDFMAHEQLSRVYEKLKQPESALWHLERAFDQQPNDRNVVTRLRELYAEYKGVQLERIQLTAGAVASQYLNGNLYGQAIEVLNKALERFPDRVDLRLMLARALSRAGQSYDAAEVAVDVLNELPYALTANRIMTELWLNEQRPSDAQRFLSRVEEVDPYLAFRLATGGNNPPPEAVALPELDYQSYVQQALAAASPDWLNTVVQEKSPSAALTTDAAEDDADWLNLLDEEGAQAGTAPLNQMVAAELDKMLPDDTSQKLRAQKGGTDQLEGGLPKEIMDRIDAMRGVSADQTVAAAPPQPDALLDMLDTDVDTGDLSDSWMKDLGIETVDEPAPRVSTGRTGMLSSLEEEVELSEDQDDSWLQELGEFDPGSPAPAAAPAPEAASERVSTGLTGMLDDLGDDAPDFFDDLLAAEADAEPPLPASQSANRASTGFTGMLDDINEDTLSEFEDKALMADFDFEAGPPVPGAKPRHESTGLTDMLNELDGGDGELEWLDEQDAPAVEPASDSSSPLAWMQDSGIEIDESAPSRFLNQALFDDVAGSSDMTGGNDNPNAWLAASGIEFNAEERADAGDLPDSSQLPGPPDDPMAWMKASGIDLDDDATDAPTIAAPPPARRRAAPPPVADTSGDWMSDESMLDEMLQLDSLTDDESAFDNSLDADSMAVLDADAAAQAPESPVDWQNTMPDNPPAWQDDEPDADEFDSMAWLSDDAADDPLAEENPVASDVTIEGDAFETEFAAESGGLDWLDENEAAMDNAPTTDDVTQSAAASNLNFFDDEAADAAEDETSFAWDAMADDEALSDDLPAETAPQGEYMWSDEQADEDDDLLDEPVAADAFAWNADADGTDDESDALEFADEAVSDSFEWSADEDADLIGLDEAAEPAADGFTWSASGDDEALDDLVLDEEFSDEALSDAPVAAADTGWMSDLTAGSTEADFNWTGENAAEDEPAADSSFAWSDDGETVDMEPVADIDSLAWDEEFDEGGETALGEPAYAAATLDEIEDEEQTLDWMVEAGVEIDENAEDEYVWDDAEDAQPSAVAGMTGLLNSLESTRYSSSLDEPVEDTPANDWLGAVEPAGEDAAADWTLDDEAAEEDHFDVVSAAGIEWNPDDALYDDELTDDEAISEGDSFAWSDDFAGEALGEADTYAEFMGEAADETGGDWLSDLTPPAAQTEGEFNWGDEPVAQNDAPGWLDMLDGEPEEEAVEETPQTATELLGSLDDEIDEAIEFEPEFAMDAEGDWLADEDAADDDMEFAPAMTNGEEEFLSFDDDEGDDYEAAGEAFEWSAELDDAPAEPVYAQVASLDVAQPLDEDSDYAAEFGEELVEDGAMTPAANAPDWLNAMVPGLDIDYEAEEDYGGTGVKTPEPAAAPARTSQADFSWLNTIVEEESANTTSAAPMSPPPALPEMPAPSIAASARGFVFKRLPAWMRGSGSNGESAALQGSPVAAIGEPDFDEFDKTQPSPAPTSSANLQLADELTALPDDEFEDMFDDDFSATYDDDFVDDDFDFDMDDVDDTDTRR
jgi:tetratricopeptide (TPR) repeat protein